MMFAVKFIYLYNCCKKPEAHKQPWKISESWCGVMRGKKSLYWLWERNWHRKCSHMAQIYCVLGFPFKSHYSHSSELAWHSHIYFSFGIQQNYDCSFKLWVREVISLSFWERMWPNYIRQEYCWMPLLWLYPMNITLFKALRQCFLASQHLLNGTGKVVSGEHFLKE